MPFLQVRDLRKSYGREDVLKGISLTLEKGQVLSIIGSSGSGKTTLLRCLCGLETPDSGEILLEGQPVHDRGAFGLVFQHFNLFPQYTVLENVTLAPLLRRMGSKETLRDQAMSLLGQVGMAEKRDAYPWQLSGGQQQRAAIARAMALHPRILCFDEPTSALDPELTGEVLRVLRGLKSGENTMIVVTHEMSFAKHVSDVVCYMADGEVIEVGTPEAVFERPRSLRTSAFIHALAEEMSI